MFCWSSQKYPLLFVMVSFFYIFISNNGFATTTAVPQNFKDIPWHIAARTVTFDNKRDLYIAQDNVVITGGKTRLEADYAEFSNKTKDAFAKGNVILISGEDSMSCNEMNINLRTQTGTVDKGTIYIQKNNFYVHGENIKKTGKFSYSAQKGSITSCSGDSPDWKITARNIKVTVEGYGVADHTVLWAKKVPAAYSPFLIFPVHTKRQTGLLAPRITSSDRKGFEFEQPLFIDISRNTDATFYADYMSDRGTKLGTEYRYILDNKTKGTVFFDVLEDKKTDDGTDQTKNYSFSGTPQRTNTDRFWLRMKHNQDLPNGVTAKLDIDVVSDEDYLHEFKDGFTGYTETKDYFEKQFGRSIDEYTDSIRKNRLNLNKTWSTYSLNMDALWYDNINARRQDTADTTLQTLPGIRFDASKQQILTSKFYYSLDTELRSFYRQDTTKTLVNGQRADFYPKFYIPLRLGRFLHFEPSIGLRQTIWHTSEFTDIKGNSDSFRTRQLYDVGAKMSTKLIKLFDLQMKSADKLKHELIPKLEYAFTPNINQDELPAFDSLDNIQEQHLITWSLTNNFISRKSNITPKGKEISTYRDIAYIKLFQSYDINKEKDNDSRPFSDIALDTQFFPNDFILLDMDLSWSPYDNHFNGLNIGNTLLDNRGDRLRTEYRYSRTLSESLYSKIDIALTRELTAYYSIEKNLKEDRDVEKQAGLSLKKSCWTFNLYFSESQDEQSISFLINLHGIGEFGTT
ncbi:LPS-assembly protein LptD [Desulfobacula phenolica]|uniref:LPS-assembly protein n=1 Tax=Desulfobacula phenolica TaxID=90732 RepID=A0A1H2DNY5_9BACT|nr:LPS assembly protein LptD [Desulfobacula phenolica]SDT84441.1 LPS-assembly protein [Desulfobacula phenolica]